MSDTWGNIISGASVGEAFGPIGAAIGGLFGGLFGGGGQQPVPYALTQEAQGYRQNAASEFGNLSAIGAQDQNLFTNLFNQALPAYEMYSGLPTSLPANQQLNIAGATGNAPTSNVTGAQGQPPNTSSGGGPQGTRPGVPTAPAGTNTPSPLPSQDVLQQQGAYSLTPAQQIQLNSQVDTINQNMSQALSQYQAQTTGNPNPAGEALIRQYYSAQADTAKANFIQESLQQKQQAAQFLIGTAEGIGSQAAQDTEAAGAGYSGLGGQTQQAYQFAQQNANSQNAGINALLGYLAQQLAAKQQQGGGNVVNNASSTPASDILTGSNIYSGGSAIGNAFDPSANLPFNLSNLLPTGAA